MSSNKRFGMTGDDAVFKFNHKSSATFMNQI